MTILQAIILGVVQGLTEFLPISSSGHLVIFQSFLDVNHFGNEFEILVHIGTLGSILVVFYDEIKMITLDVKSKETQKYISFIITGTFPAIFIGLGLKGTIENLFDNLFAVGLALVFTGIVLFTSIFFVKKNQNNNYKKSLLIGIAQALAIVPGISRSGMTICTALILGMNSKEAAKFSFLLAIPAISGAGLLMVLNIGNEFQIQFPVALVALLSSFITGIFSLKWLISWLENGKFYYFGIYCFLLGILIIIH